MNRRPLVATVAWIVFAISLAGCEEKVKPLEQDLKVDTDALNKAALEKVAQDSVQAKVERFGGKLEHQSTVLGAKVHIDLSKSKITNANLKEMSTTLAALPEFSLDLSQTEVTDAGLRHLKICKNLRQLTAKGVELSPDAIKEFTSAAPGCQIKL